MTGEELQLRRVVVSISGLLYWGGVLIQARRVHKQIGHSPNLKPRGAKEKALWLVWFLVIVFWVGQPFLIADEASKPGLNLLRALLHPAGLLLGLILVVLGYACTLWCYAAMGNTWRIGINAKEKTTLVSRGPYRYVRHPIYLFQIVMLTGAAMLLPTLASIAMLMLHWVCILIKARDEEDYLTRIHGEAYSNYLNRTGRLFPKLTRK